MSATADLKSRIWPSSNPSCCCRYRPTQSPVSAGVDASLVGRVMERGVVVAGGLHPEIKDRYFRVGHMGYAATRPEMLERTIEAIRASL